MMLIGPPLAHEIYVPALVHEAFQGLPESIQGKVNLQTEPEMRLIVSDDGADSEKALLEAMNLTLDKVLEAALEAHRW